MIIFLAVRDGLRLVGLMALQLRKMALKFNGLRVAYKLRLLCCPIILSE